MSPISHVVKTCKWLEYLYSKAKSTSALIVIPKIEKQCHLKLYNLIPEELAKVTENCSETENTDCDNYLTQHHNRPILRKVPSKVSL